MIKRVVSVVSISCLVVFASLLAFSRPAQENTNVPKVFEIPIMKAEEKTKSLIQTSRKVLHLDLKGREVIELTGEINESSLPVAQKINRLTSEGKKVVLLVDSPGGSVMDGSIIVTALQNSIDSTVICMELCASMAAVILEYGHNRYAVDRSVIMFHPASGGMRGTLGQMTSRLDSISRYVGKLDSYIASRSGQTLEEFHLKTNNELWLDAEDAFEQKYLDGIVTVDYESPASVFMLPLSGSAKEQFNFDWK